MKTIKITMVFMLLSTFVAFSQGNETKESLALIKQNFEQSQTNIKKYSWIETATVYLNGEQKSVEQNQCYYDVTGTLVKVATGATTQPKEERGIRGRIADRKIDELKEYITKAKTQIKAYIPPQSSKLEQIYASGGMGVKILDPGMKYELDFPDYLKAGDMLSIVVNTSNKILMNYNIKTYMDTPSDAVTLDVAFQTLPDGTSYSGNVTFTAPSQNLKIVTVNSGYKLGSGQ